MLFHHPETLPRIICVSSPHPHAPDLAYTEEAWSGAGVGLVAWAPQVDRAADLLRAVAHLPPEIVEADASVPLPELERGAVVRFNPCTEETVDRMLLARSPAGLAAPYLQVTVVHSDRRLHEELTCDCCPDLRHTGDDLHRRPFAPVVRGLGGSVRLLPPTGTQLLAVDVRVRVGGEAAARLETLLAEEAEGGVRLLQAPVIADWTAAGAVVRPEPPRWKGDTPRVELDQQVSSHLTVGVALERSGLVGVHHEAVDVAVDRLHELGAVATTETGHWLAVSVPGPLAARARSVLRRLVRDGHAHEVGSYDRPARSPERCVHCAAGVP